MALVGASTKNPGVTCFVEHGGQFLANLWHARALAMLASVAVSTPNPPSPRGLTAASDRWGSSAWLTEQHASTRGRQRARLAASCDLGGCAVGTVQVRSLEQPDETRSFPNGAVEMVTIADTMIGRARFQPGWRWSNDVKPIAGTDWCMVLHEGYCVSGSAIVRAEDGTETRVGPGDGYVIQPGARRLGRR